MSMFDRLLNRRGGGIRPTRIPFQRVLSHKDWWKEELETAPGAIECPAGKWSRIGEFTIPPQQQIYFGFGSPITWQNQGYMHLALYDDTPVNSGLVNGVVRLRQMNANETLIVVIYEGRTEVLRGDVNDKNKMIALPFQGQTPHNLTIEDCKMSIEFKADVPSTIVRNAIGTSAELDIWNLPVSVLE